MPDFEDNKTAGPTEKRVTVSAGQTVTVLVNGVVDSDFTITAPAGDDTDVTVVIQARQQDS